MPLYEYKCHSCGKTIEVIQKFSDEPLKIHEACGGELEKLMSLSAFQLKGSGWYATDYGSKSNGGVNAKSEESKSGESKDGKDGKSDPAKNDSAPSESKSGDSKPSESKSSDNKSSDSKSSESKPAGAKSTPAPAPASSDSKS